MNLTTLTRCSGFFRTPCRFAAETTSTVCRRCRSGLSTAETPRVCNPMKWRQTPNVNPNATSNPSAVFLFYVKLRRSLVCHALASINPVVVVICLGLPVFCGNMWSLEGLTKMRYWKFVFTPNEDS
ncbi:unnamed protein product [Durusdinium trenchii]|uniref:Transmembrane protein n=1 Tax=Durusdinium trenchii TaxID=1381693 RepID=A0ABP0MSA7_9DINO